MKKYLQKKFIIIGIIAVVLIGTIVFLSLGKKTMMPMMQMPMTEVGIITVKHKNFPLEQELIGRVKPFMQSDVRPQVDGIVKEMIFKEGSYVKTGQVLYKLDSATYQASYDQTIAALKSTEANLQASKLKAERYEKLIKYDGVSRQEYDDAQALYQQDLANIEEKKAAVQTAKINLERTEIKAPISGYISISNITPGALVTANQSESLTVIRELDPIYVDMTQSSSQILKLRLLPKNKSISKFKTIKVKLRFEDGTVYKHTGEMKLQEIAIDENTGTVTMRAQFPNPDNILMPGMYVSALVNGANANDGILLQQEAVFFDAKGNAEIYIINNENKVESHIIKIGPAVKDKWSVVDGLKAGERVVVEGINKIQPGQEVKPVEVSHE